MCYAYQFTKTLCCDFLDWVYYDRESSPQTRNNYRGWLVSLGNFMTERGYLEENPASGIQKMRTGDKLRSALEPNDLRRLSNYLRDNDRYFLLACMMEYYTFIRPTELSFIRVGDIDVKNRQILVRGTFAKNHKDMMVAVNPKVLHLMIDLGIFNHPGGHYIFSKGLRPGEEYQSPEQFNRKWHKLRGVMGWPESYKFYSLKDSGIRDLANESGIVVARDQARHRDITTTNKYLTARGTSAPEAAKDFDGEM